MMIMLYHIYHIMIHNSEYEFVPMKQVLPPVEVSFVQKCLRRTRKGTFARTCSQAITFQSLRGSITFLIYKSWKLNHRPSYWTVWKNCLNSAKNLEDIVYGSWWFYILWRIVNRSVRCENQLFYHNNSTRCLWYELNILLVC